MAEEKKLKQLKEWFEHEIKKRDREIEKLKKENKALLKTAFKQAAMNLNLKALAEDKDGRRRKHIRR